MKNLLSILLVVMLAASSAFAQSTVASLLKKYNNDKDVLAFDLKGDLMNFFEKMDEGGTELQSEVESVSILMFNVGDDISEGDRDKMKTILDSEGFAPLINARHEGQKVKVFAKDTGAFIEKLFAEVKTESHNIYVSLNGEIHYDDLSKINVDQFGNTGKMLKN